MIFGEYQVIVGETFRRAGSFSSQRGGEAENAKKG
jgi:hypothetical protein